MLAQTNSTVGDLSGNLQKITDAIKAAKKRKIPLVVFPEMALLGYPPDDFLLYPHFIKKVEQSLQEVIQASRGVAVVIGTVRYQKGEGEKSLYNTAAVIEDGKLLGYQDKTLLPTYDVFDERRYFSPAKGSKVWKIAGHKFGITICEDIWQHGGAIKEAQYAQDPVGYFSQQSIDALLNLSASPYHYQKLEKRILLCHQIAKSLNVPVFLCNQVGGNDSLIFSGYSMAVYPKNGCECLAKGFQEDLFEVTDVPMLSYQPMEKEPLKDLYAALILGVKDYFFKQGFRKACLGLSGGVDSALVACIAKEALGSENVLGIMMPSRYSSESSITDAEKLARNLGIEVKTLSIDSLYQQFLDHLDPHFKNLPFDSTEENLQARIRGMLLMAFSNKQGYILLSTGNKSESALGYTTLYGDMCGGLSVISDLTKRQVYALCSWINQFNNKEVIPRSILEKPPSAELREDQKDSDTLPPYDMIDNILESYVELHLSAAEIIEKYEYPEEVVRDIICKVHQNEYKRRQMPLGLRVTGKAFTAGRRFPIVQKAVNKTVV